LTGSAAYESLMILSKVSKGKHVFIWGASGGVGSFAIQIAKLYEATITTVSSTESMSVCKSLGADYTFDITINNKKIFNDLYSKIDIAIDCIGNLEESIEDYMNSGGKIISLNWSSNFTSISKNILSWFSGVSYEFPTIQPNSKILNTLAKLVSDKKIKVCIEQVYRLSDIGNAHNHLEKKKKIGKLILEIQEHSSSSSTGSREHSLSNTNVGLTDLIKNSNKDLPSNINENNKETTTHDVENVIKNNEEVDIDKLIDKL